MNITALLLTLGVLVCAVVLWVIGEGRRAPMRIRLPRRLVRREIGLGDLIKRITSLFGIAPCAACQRRALALNQRVRFAPTAAPSGARPYLPTTHAFNGLPGGVNNLGNMPSPGNFPGAELLGLVSPTIFPPEAPSAQITGFDTFCRFGVLLCRGWTLSPDMGKVYNGRASICGFCAGLNADSAQNPQTKRCKDQNKKSKRQSNYRAIKTRFAAPLIGLIIVGLLGGTTDVVAHNFPPRGHTSTTTVSTLPPSPSPSPSPSPTPRATLVTYENSAILSNTAFTTVSVSCQGGEQMVSGGYVHRENSDGTALVTSSYPSDANTWTVSALALSGVPTLTAQVVCLQANFPVTITTATAQTSSPPISTTNPLTLSATASCAPDAIPLGGGEQLTPDGMGAPPPNVRLSYTRPQPSGTLELFTAVPIASQPVSGGWSVTDATVHLPNTPAPANLPPLGGQFTLTAYAICASQGLQAASQPSQTLTAPSPVPSPTPGSLNLPQAQLVILTGQIGCDAGQLPVGAGFSDQTAAATSEPPGELFEWDVVSSSSWSFSYAVSTTQAYSFAITAVCVSY